MPGSGQESANWKPPGSSHPSGDGFPDPSGSDYRSIPGNRFQREAIRHFTGPCEVLAGPGSGKTFVLVERILRLIQYHRIDPSRILVLTFSRSAAREMRARFLKRSAPDSYPVTFGTFHSVFYQILRASQPDIVWSVISAARQKELVSVLMQRYSAEPDQRKPSEEETSRMISLLAVCKMTGKYPASGTSADHTEQMRIRGILHGYNQYLEDNHLIDFEDMTGRCAALLGSRNDILHRWQEQFQFILVDEFQDINAGQFEILRLLAGHRRNLFVVGDDDQSIYGFRGSDPRFMTEFRNWFDGAKLLTLEINYRCPPDVITQSRKVIRGNRFRLEKNVIPDRKSGGPVELIASETGEAEYEWIAGQLQQMTMEQQRGCAVIFRTHAQMAGVIRCFDRKGVPFRQWGMKESGSSPRVSPEGQRLFETIRSYCRLASGAALKRSDLFAVINCPERFIPRNVFHKENYTEQDLIRLFPQGSRDGREMCRLLRDLHIMNRLSPEMSWKYLKRLLGESVTGSVPSGEWKALDQWMTWTAGDEGTLQGLCGKLNRTELSGIMNASGLSGSGNRESNGVLLLTMHASKGLEFGTVFIPDLNEGVIPSRNAQGETGIEEERRLLYVAMTRAREYLALLYIRGTGMNPRRPSRFLEALGVKAWE